MSNYIITLYGINSFFNNNELFKNLTFPEGIDKDIFIATLIDRYGEFELIYANPEYLQFIIGIWSAKHQLTFKKWINALNTKYNPLENYDRYEEIEESGENVATSTIDSENKKSAYDTKSYTPFEKHENLSNDMGSHNFRHQAHLHGNIGVTKAQEMLKDELEVAKWNLYDNLSLLFAEEFLLLVY